MLQRLARTLDEITLVNAGWRADETGRFLAVQLLKAMPDPTENMAIAGGEAVPGDEPYFHSEVTKDVWREMVEDILAGADG